MAEQETSSSRPYGNENLPFVFGQNYVPSWSPEEEVVDFNLAPMDLTDELDQSCFGLNHSFPSTPYEHLNMYYFPTVWDHQTPDLHPGQAFINDRRHSTVPSMISLSTELAGASPCLSQQSTRHSEPPYSPSVQSSLSSDSPSTPKFNDHARILRSVRGKLKEDSSGFAKSSPQSLDVHEMSQWGYENADGSWTCRFNGCKSCSTFTRTCDLRKHYKRHYKQYYCRHKDCPKSVEDGFSTKEDRGRHETMHNPRICCEWEGCGKIFSRRDNMRDHVKRVHLKAKR